MAFGNMPRAWRKINSREAATRTDAILGCPLVFIYVGRFVCVFVKASLIPGFGGFAGRPIWRRALINISAGFFPPMENLTPLMVVGAQVTPASTGPSGVVKYGDIPFSLRLMPKPGPNLSFPLISAIDLFGFIGGAGLAAHPAYQFFSNYCVARRLYQSGRWPYYLKAAIWMGLANHLRLLSMKCRAGFSRRY